MAQPNGISKAKRGWVGLALALVIGVTVGWLHLSSDPWLEGLDQGATLDWRFRLRGPKAPPNDIAVIVVDDRSLAKIGQWPWPRAKLAEMVEYIRMAGAKSVGFDILLSEHEVDGSGSGDQILADALKRQGHAVIATALLFNNGSPNAGKVEDVGHIALGNLVNQEMGFAHVITADEILRPLPAFESVAAVGHVNQQSAEIGQTRAQYPVIAYGEALIPSFPLLLAAQQRDLPMNSIGFDFAGRLIFGAQKFALDDRYGLGLNYLGPTGTFRTYSALDLLEQRIPPALLKGRAVLVGVSATSLGDNFTTPYSLDLPGVEVLATAVANLMHGDALIRTPEQRILEALGIIFLAGLAWRLGIRAQRLLGGIGSNLVLLGGWLAFAQIMFTGANRLVAVSGPLVAILAGAALGLLSRMVLERRLRSEAERQRGNLARYVPPSLAETLAERATPAFDAREQLAAVMFVDLQGFTHASEERSPADTAQFLKSFHAQIEDVVTAHGGIVAQFLGDGALVLWGLPQPRDDDPAQALACAREMLLRLQRWHPENPARVGLHFGPVAMAQLGGRHQAQLAAAGDTVNVASRLEAAAKSTGTVLVISDDMVAAIRALGRGELINGLRSRPDQPVRGRDKPISYWSAPSCTDLV
ncbi:MAG: adenylate/guanylate cyclase domain-containing protein [Proteobacteria bacterium]|nr:adenylate/guanylate cyclase domain-containing protein [Pseudomonadota bacterium]